jgi:uncharacterized phage infection (PIP) family protein YhgE
MEGMRPTDKQLALLAEMKPLGDTLNALLEQEAKDLTATTEKLHLEKKLYVRQVTTVQNLDHQITQQMLALKSSLGTVTNDAAWSDAMKPGDEDVADDETARKKLKEELQPFKDLHEAIVREVEKLGMQKLALNAQMEAFNASMTRLEKMTTDVEALRLPSTDIYELTNNESEDEIQARVNKIKAVIAKYQA